MVGEDSSRFARWRRLQCSFREEVLVQIRATNLSSRCPVKLNERASRRQDELRRAGGAVLTVTDNYLQLVGSGLKIIE